MKVNQKILSIPPYISTSWKNIVSIHVETREEKNIFVIVLVNGSTIEIPDLPLETLDLIFQAHIKYLEYETNLMQEKDSPRIFPGNFFDEQSNLISLPLSIGMDGNMGNFLQHNPEASQSPDLPKEILEKIVSLSKAIGLESGENFPKPEPHCNCMHCQIMRVLKENPDSISDKEEENEEVTEEDLTFRDWDIVQSGENLYIVTNPLNSSEEYNVFLGNPIGCTCGQANCEHIRSVLNS